MNIKFFNHPVDPNMLDALACSLYAFDDKLESVYIYACEKTSPISDDPLHEIHLKAILVNGKEISLIESRGDKKSATFNITRRLSRVLENQYKRRLERQITMANG